MTTLFGSSPLNQVVDDDVREILSELEAKDSFMEANVVEITPIESEDPYETFETHRSGFTEESKSLIQTLTNTNHRGRIMAVAFELPSGDIAIDLFTNQSSDLDRYPAIESLARELNVDQSSVNQIVGRSVNIGRIDGRWKIVNIRGENVTEKSVDKMDYINPLIIAGLLIPLGVGIGYFTTISTIITGLIGGILSVVVYAFMLYLLLARRRDHELPSLIKHHIVPNHTEGVNEIENGDIVDVEQGEFQSIRTLAEEDGLENKRSVMENLVIDVYIPGHGDVTVPVPGPTNDWSSTKLKRLVYHLSPSVAELDRTTGRLVPLSYDSGEIVLDESRLPVEPKNEITTTSERVADIYVGGINNTFNTPTREEKLA